MQVVATEPERAAIETKRSGKNIVLCFDGTGDWAAADTTNVMKIYERLDKNSQLVFYSGGVGTLGNAIALSPLRRFFLKLLDLAVATSLRERVLDGYTFLVQNYQAGDRIYLFGFSRGAFTARVLASLIHNFGLLEVRNQNLIPYLWQTISEFTSIVEFKKQAATIKEQFSRLNPPGIEFMGLFDTVSSVGIFERFKVYPYTNKNSSVVHARHAVSLDEQRNAFPELLFVCDGNDISEVWFPGVHRDIGGGDNKELGWPNETLGWIVGEASSHGLAIQSQPEPPSERKIHLPGFDIYAFVGLYPMKMFDYALHDLKRANWSYSSIIDRLSKRSPTRDSGFRWFWPNFKHPRPLPKNAFTFLADGQVLSVSNTFLADGQVLSVSNGNTIPIGEARCVEPPLHHPTRLNVQDTIGIVLGVTLSFLIANRGMESPFGESWPAGSSSWVFWLFLANVMHQGFSQWLAARPAGKRFNQVAPIVGLLLSLWLILRMWPWTTLVIGVSLGVIVALLSLVGRRPIMPANRVIPYFIVPWFGIIVGLWPTPYLLQLFCPIFAALVQWLFHWTMPWDLTPFLKYIAWGLAIMTGLSGISQIIQDRRKMEARPVPQNHA